MTQLLDFGDDLESDNDSDTESKTEVQEEPKSLQRAVNASLLLKEKMEALKLQREQAALREQEAIAAFEKNSLEMARLKNLAKVHLINQKRKARELSEQEEILAAATEKVKRINMEVENPFTVDGEELDPLSLVEDFNEAENVVNTTTRALTENITTANGTVPTPVVFTLPAARGTVVPRAGQTEANVNVTDNRPPDLNRMSRRE